MVTINDVASAAGVSISTVSRVINQSNTVSVATRNRVMEIIRELGYSPGPTIKKENRKSNKLIGVLFPDISNNVFGRILQGINSVVTPLGYNTVICETNGELDKEKIQYDEKCRIKRFYDYEEEKIVRTYTHYYDDKDRIIKTELLYSNNKKEYWANSYDMANNLTKTIYKNNKEADKDIYRYDKDNNLLSKITYKGNKEIEKTLYTYDEYQNTTKIEKYNNVTTYIYERTFTYYE